MKKPSSSGCHLESLMEFQGVCAFNLTADVLCHDSNDWFTSSIDSIE